MGIDPDDLGISSNKVDASIMMEKQGA